MRRFSILILCLFWSGLAQAQEKKETIEQTPAEMLLSKQIASNSQVVRMIAPRPRIDSLWQESTGWQSGNYGAIGIAMLLEIDQNLIAAVVNLWAEKLDVKSQEKLTAAREDLIKRFERNGAKTYLLLSGQLNGGGYSSWWSYSYPDLKSGVTFRSFGGAVGKIEQMENCSKKKITLRSPIFTCLFFISAPVEEYDPLYHVDVPVKFHVQENYKRTWIDAATTSIMSFRFEVSKVPLVQLAKDNINLSNLDDIYVRPHVASIEATSGADAIRFLFSVGARIAAGLLLRGIRIR